MKINNSKPFRQKIKKKVKTNNNSADAEIFGANFSRKKFKQKSFVQNYFLQNVGFNYGRNYFYYLCYVVIFFLFNVWPGVNDGIVHWLDDKL